MLLSLNHKKNRHLGHAGANSLTKRSLKGSYSVSKGAAMWAAPVGSPTYAELAFKVAFSNYLRFPLVPPAKLPKVAFSNYLQFPLVPPAKLPTE